MLQTRSLVIVATHSPEFLRDPDAHPVIVTRDEHTGATTLDRSFDSVEATAEMLGVDLLEMFRMKRLILLVEGHHDAIVLEEMLGSELRSLRVLVTPLHGGRHIPSVADSQFLATFTTQPIAIMTDNSETSVFDRLLVAARSHQANGRPLEDVFKSLLRSKPKEEEKFISSLYRRAYDAGTLERFHAIGMTLPDILEYLPVDSFCSSASSWQELRTEHQNASVSRGFKPWLEETRGASFSD